MDFPRAWQIARETPYEQHHERCSYRVSEGELLCDCHILRTHAEYGDQEEGPIRSIRPALPGEAEAIQTVKELGAKFGYNNLIFHLQNAWSTHLHALNIQDLRAIDLAVGHICVYCGTDRRTGEKIK